MKIIIVYNTYIIKYSIITIIQYMFIKIIFIKT